MLLACPVFHPRPSLPLLLPSGRCDLSSASIALGLPTIPIPYTDSVQLPLCCGMPHASTAFSLPTNYVPTPSSSSTQLPQQNSIGIALSRICVPAPSGAISFAPGGLCLPIHNACGSSASKKVWKVRPQGELHLL
eukprot:GGOE01018975.1.p2 GENE.GGOE01018975.1~~GGOE01018975.1.p2  ORF type:complete len:135 (+),score=15.97 GGOE01018975.1:174-578(+)